MPDQKELRTGQNVWSRGRTTEEIWKSRGMQVESLVRVPLKLMLYLGTYYFGFSWVKIKWCWLGAWLYTCWRSEKIECHLGSSLVLNSIFLIILFQKVSINFKHFNNMRNGALNERFVMMICNVINLVL